MADQRLLAALSDFARTLVRPYAIADVLIQLTDRVTAALDLGGAGVSLADHAEHHVCPARAGALDDCARR